MTLLAPRRGAEPLGVELAAHGDRLALVSGSTHVSYAELAGRVEEVAARLGATRRLVVAPLTPTIGGVAGYLGALAGGHPVLVSDDDPDRIASLTARVDPDVVLVPGADGVDLEQRRTGTRHTLHPELAALLPTSGSTGAPRLVRLSHTNLRANAEAIATYLSLSDADLAITSLPLHYCYGLSVLHSHLVRGGGVVLTDLSVVDRCFWDTFRSAGVTNLAGVPYTFELLDRVGFDQLQLPSLRIVTQAGGRLPPEHVVRLARQGERDGWQLFVMYGQTEATARIAYLPPSLAATCPSSIGVAVPGGSLRLAPVAGAAPGEGELVYSGPNVMLGYADGPADLALGRVVTELHTGDIARRDEHGRFEIVGRRSRFAKVCGLRLDLDQLEALLRAQGIEALCASDDEVVVVALTAPDRVAVAVDVVRTTTGLPATRVRASACRELPRLPNGKPDHRAVIDLAATMPATDPGTAGDHDEPARAVFRRILGATEIGDDDTFVSLGGDSLSYVEASIALEAEIGDLPSDWPHLPVSTLVARGGGRSRWPRTETGVVLRAGAIVLVVGMHLGLWPWLGGAHLLLLMAGYSFGRFQGTTSGRLQTIARIALPSAAWLAIAMHLNPRIGWAHVLQVNGWIGGPNAHGGYWFVEALVQILLVLTAVLAIPAVQRLERRAPVALASLALGAGLLVRFDVVDLPTVEPHDIRPHDIFWLFALGWAAAAARTTRGRAVLSAVLLVALPGYFGEPQREALIAVGGLLLLWVPTIRVPRAITTPVGLVAGASLYVYLTHWQVFPPVRDAAGPVAALLASLAVGVLLWRATRAVEVGARRVLARQRISAPAP